MYSIDINKVLMGAAENFYDICWIYPLRLNETIGLGKGVYEDYLSILISDVYDIQKELKKNGVPEEEMNFTAFEYLLIQASLNSNFLLKLQKAFSTFIREKIHIAIDEKRIFIGDNFQKEKSINEDNFEDFQTVLRVQNKIPVSEHEPIPKNESAMARKFRLRREQVAEAKRRQAEKNGEFVTLADSISSLICLNVGVNFENVGDLTIYQFKELLERAQRKYKYELDIRMIAAGADPKKIKPKQWFGKLD